MPPEWWSAIGTPAASSTRFEIPPPGPGAPAARGAGGDIESLIREVAGRFSFPDPDLLVATARQESGLNPRAVGDSGNSRGIFQENIRGRGAGLAPEQSFDPVGATERAIREFQAIRARNPTVDRGTWAALAQRPLDAQGYARSVNALLGAAPSGGGRPAPAAAPPPAASGPDWWQGLPGARDLVERPSRAEPGPPVARQPLPDTGSAGLRPEVFQPLTGGTSPAGSSGAAMGAAGGPAPAWWMAVDGAGGSSAAGGAVSGQAAGRPVGETPAKQAVAASWALSQLGSRDFYNLCQRFIEQAYGTGGQFGSAAAAGKALFKTADPAQADVGDLVFFRPDASNGYAGHAAIYLGNGEMVGATNAGVTRDNIFTNPYWRNLLVGFGDPPSQWQGRRGGGVSVADLQKGASSLVQGARQAIGSGATPAWWGAVTGGTGGTGMTGGRS